MARSSGRVILKFSESPGTARTSKPYFAARPAPSLASSPPPPAPASTSRSTSTRKDDARDLAVNDEPLHDVLQDRLSRQRQELLRNVAAEAGARTGRWNDDENRHECRVPSAEQTESGADGSAPGTQHPALRPP